MKPHDYYSRGKLMISGEYLVLHGATALAIPLRFGQGMSISERPEKNILFWETHINDHLWFQAIFSMPGFETIQHNNAESANFVSKVLRAAKEINPDYLPNDNGKHVECYLDFDIRWGLGSSSSLISNVAYWAGIDPLELHSSVSRGSGYDVACARSSTPILFTNAIGKKKTIPVVFNPQFSDNIYFVYLGKKQDSQKDVDNFMRTKSGFEKYIELISNISRQMVTCMDYDEFAELVRKHEEIMTKVLGKQTLKSSAFKDFPGEIKSLGAWGGDFAMALWPHSHEEFVHYLLDKHLNTFFKFNNITYGSGKNDT